ncbi:hypothetical protein HDV63DRAFT_28878 [Trichoderma sp. SZMC 28014]
MVMRPKARPPSHICHSRGHISSYSFAILFLFASAGSMSLFRRLSDLPSFKLRPATLLRRGFVAPDRCTMSCHPFQGSMTTQPPIWLHGNAQQHQHAYSIPMSNILLHSMSSFPFFLVRIAVLYRFLRQYLASGATPSSPLRSPHFDSATTQSPTTSASCAQPRQIASSNFNHMNQPLLNLRESQALMQTPALTRCRLTRSWQAHRADAPVRQ